jgi:mevalonate pyrophosphate decarboxylase
VIGKALYHKGHEGTQRSWGSPSSRVIAVIGKAKTKTNLPFASSASFAVKAFAFQFSLLAISAILAILSFVSFVVKGL